MKSLVKNLIVLADSLDKKGFHEEANLADRIAADFASSQTHFRNDLPTIKAKLAEYESAVSKLGWGTLSKPEDWENLHKIVSNLADYFKQAVVDVGELVSRSKETNKRHETESDKKSNATLRLHRKSNA